MQIMHWYSHMLGDVIFYINTTFIIPSIDETVLETWLLSCTGGVEALCTDLIIFLHALSVLFFFPFLLFSSPLFLCCSEGHLCVDWLGFCHLIVCLCLVYVCVCVAC